MSVLDETHPLFVHPEQLLHFALHLAIRPGCVELGKSAHSKDDPPGLGEIDGSIDYHGILRVHGGKDQGTVRFVGDAQAVSPDFRRSLIALNKIPVYHQG